MKMHGCPAPGQSRLITIREHQTSGVPQATLITNTQGELSLWRCVKGQRGERLAGNEERRALYHLTAYWRRHGKG